MSDVRTIVTGPMRAVAGPHTTAIERHGTFPLTPSGPRTDDLTAAPPRAPEPEPPPRSDPPRVRAVSASHDPQQALEAYQTPREHDYDKLVGQTLDGRYHVQQKIGEGGMGVVFAARHAVIERPLAIKVLKREVMRDPATSRRFEQEAKAASRIGHPNIVDVTDFGTTPDGMTYSVMEYVSGQTLGRTLRRGPPFPMTRAIRIAVQIARALGAAHDKGIVHRDLKPENVFLVDRDGRPDFVKIVDFGIAKVSPLPGQAAGEPRLTRAGSVFGTPEYMAPEQAAGRGDTDGRVDIYALGVILYEMVTGKVPHKGDSMVRTLAMQMLDPPVPPTKARPDLEISPELEAVILKALAKKREHRYQTMGELLAALESVQPVVGTSLTGSPVYALVPLPPGADPGLASAPTAVPQAAPIPSTPVPANDSVPLLVPQPITDVGASRRPRTPTGPASRRLKDEPEFVAAEKPHTFEHVFSEERAAPRRRPWPVLLLLALLLGGAAGAIALVAQRRGETIAEGPRPADPPPADAALIALAPTDAPAVTPAPADAAPAPADATTVPVTATPPDAAARVTASPRDAGAAATVPAGRPIQIKVLTQPETATLYDANGYRGPGGAHLSEPLGTKLEVKCRQAGYKDGSVKLVFDGKQEAALCVLQRIVVCIPGVKNPFDNCPE